MANTTSQASTGADGTASTAFNWQNPVFPLPSARSRAANADRLPGVLHSHRPRWTPGKHARILAQIKGTRTDLNPTFPRPAAVPQAAVLAHTVYQLSEVISNLAQGSKSYFDSLTTQALEQLYSPLPAPATTGAAQDQGQQKAAFIEHLGSAMFSKDEAANVVVAWTANSIPLNAYTAPRNYRENFDFYVGEKFEKGVSGAMVVGFTTDKGEKLIIKCFPPASESDAAFAQKISLTTGIDAQNPKWEARCLLANLIAHDILGWDIVPKTWMGYFGGRACLVMERIAGINFHKKVTNDIQLTQLYTSSIRDGVIHMDELGICFKPEFKNDYIRLSLFSMLIGDVDRHYGQFLTNAQGNRPSFLKGIDWDFTFGSRITNDVLAYRTENQRRLPWPDPIPQTICDEFGKVSEDDLRKAAATFELSDEEVAALMLRFDLIKKKLATSKKI